MVRSRFSQSDDELKEILGISESVSAGELGEYLRTIVDAFKEYRGDMSILEESEIWIENLDEKRGQTQEPVEVQSLWRLAEMIRILRVLAELAVLELADEGFDEYMRLTATEEIEEVLAADAQRREALFRLISESEVL